MIRGPTISTRPEPLLPYTTLFRSYAHVRQEHRRQQDKREAEGGADGGDRGIERALDAVGRRPSFPAVLVVVAAAVNQHEARATEGDAIELRGRRRSSGLAAFVELGLEDERSGGEVLQQIGRAHV